MAETTPEPGSFRDPHNRVFYREGEVYRALSPQALAHWRAVEPTAFFRRFSEAGQLIGTRLAPEQSVPAPAGGPWAAVLHHDRVPFVSYPYEWTFHMLQAAAALQLELLQSALAEGLTLQDASSFNIQWFGARPVFIDVASFVPWQAGQPWVGYRQFCQLFLYPLLLQAHRDVPFQPWLRGAIDGIPVDVCRELLRGDFYKAGVLRDVIIHAWMQRRYAGTTRPVGDDLRNAGFQKELILANLKRLSGLVAGLTWKGRASEWSGYAQEHSYSAPDYQRKGEFIRRAARSKPRRRVWDLGCNTGDFSKIAAEHADYVVAVDGDARAIDTLFKTLQAHGPRNILPLTMNLADPSAGLGWMGQERKAFVERGHPDLVLCLALVHHMALSANIPLNEWLHWLADLRADLVIEFVGRQDPRVEQLLQNKDEKHPDYNQAAFESLLAEFFTVRERLELCAGRRTLYSCEVKS